MTSEERRKLCHDLRNTYAVADVWKTTRAAAAEIERLETALRVCQVGFAEMTEKAEQLLAMRMAEINPNPPK